MQWKHCSNVATSITKEMGSGLNVSIQEVPIIIWARKNILSPNGVSLEEIEEVNAMGVQINIDNLSILEQFVQNIQMFLYVSVSTRT
jgi:diaminopimelate decarboxylase